MRGKESCYSWSLSREIEKHSNGGFALTNNTKSSMQGAIDSLKTFIIALWGSIMSKQDSKRVKRIPPQLPGRQCRTSIYIHDQLSASKTLSSKPETSGKKKKKKQTNNANHFNLDHVFINSGHSTSITALCSEGLKWLYLINPLGFCPQSVSLSTT